MATPHSAVRMLLTAACTAGFSISAQFASAAAEETAVPQPAVYCRPLRPDRERLRDYRRKDATAEMRWATADNESNHTGPAVKRMQAGEYSRTVMADLDWTLMLWPNHYRALGALVRYELAGGKAYEFEKPECYFARAREFAPRDVLVVLTEAYYYWKKGDHARAVTLYEEALAIDSDSIDAHYNLGLLYLERSEFDKAREHAKAAYAHGYPLPGLRKKLMEAGHW